MCGEEVCVERGYMWRGGICGEEVCVEPDNSHKICGTICVK